MIFFYLVASVVALFNVAANVSSPTLQLGSSNQYKYSNAKNLKKQFIRLILGYCSNGSKVVATCFPNYVCGRGFWCDKAINRCCEPKYININIHLIKMPLGPTSTPVDNNLLCRDGSPAASKCYNDRCQIGFVCSIDGLCCRSGTTASCNYQGEPIGLCDRGQCDIGHYCSKDGFCCPAQGGTIAYNNCPDGQPPIGHCVFNLCPLEYDCMNGQICCPSMGTQEIYESPDAICPDNAEPVGPCVDGFCPDNFACVNDVCCPTENAWQPYNAVSRRGKFTLRGKTNLGSN